MHPININSNLINLSLSQNLFSLPQPSHNNLFWLSNPIFPKLGQIPLQSVTTNVFPPFYSNLLPVQSSKGHSELNNLPLYAMKNIPLDLNSTMQKQFPFLSQHFNASLSSLNSAEILNSRLAELKCFQDSSSFPNFGLNNIKNFDSAKTEPNLVRSKEDQPAIPTSETQESFEQTQHQHHNNPEATDEYSLDEQATIGDRVKVIRKQPRAEPKFVITHNREMSLDEFLYNVRKVLRIEDLPMPLVERLLKRNGNSTKISMKRVTENPRYYRKYFNKK